MSGRVAILGPQRPRPNIAAVLEHHGVDGPVALITAGWRLDEAELLPLQRDLGRRVVHLPIYRWFEEVSAAEPGLAAGYRARQRRIRRFKGAYRSQVELALQAVEDLQARQVEDPELFGPELEHALQTVRSLDRRVLARLNELRAGFPEVCEPWAFPAVQALHARIRDTLGVVSAVLVAGGHVAVLRNRLFFFGLDVLLPPFLEGGGLIAAWSAGAMALTDEILLFYDDPPEGPGTAELLDAGLGIVPGAVFLPHAAMRLRCSDEARMARLAARLQPRVPVTLESGSWLDIGPDGWTDRGDPAATRLVGVRGDLASVAPGAVLGAPRTTVRERTVLP